MSREKIGKAKSLQIFLLSLLMPVLYATVIFFENILSVVVLASIIFINRLIITTEQWENEPAVIIMGKLSNRILIILLIIFFGFNVIVPLEYIIGWLVISAIYCLFFILQSFSQLQTDWQRRWVNNLD